MCTVSSKVAPLSSTGLAPDRLQTSPTCLQVAEPFADYLSCDPGHGASRWRRAQEPACQCDNWIDRTIAHEPNISRTCPIFPIATSGPDSTPDAVSTPHSESHQVPQPGLDLDGDLDLDLDFDLDLEPNTTDANLTWPSWHTVKRIIPFPFGYRKCHCPAPSLALSLSHVGRMPVYLPWGGRPSPGQVLVGYWYSLPQAAECPEGVPVGTGGCRWRQYPVARVVRGFHLLANGFEVPRGHPTPVGKRVPDAVFWHNINVTSGVFQRESPLC